ncbi:hypothetical protein JTE90_026449 [Oedothorax gibbosus]|uniref:Transmembrane protein n=1 Tax=Oedothorax gibbosus TaxID=931172 RepID=A0AAV6VR71_9ARAC|nr:hypothetical protein JTE90_026449 [Oedothorax gibbosus]
MTTFKKDEPNKPISSLSYQILLVSGWWVFQLYFFAICLAIIFKKIYFVYPTTNLVSEIALLCFLFGTESIRIFLGKKGNLTERMLSVVLSLLLTVPVTCGVSYFMWWQTYILKSDLIVSIIMLVFYTLQTLFAIFTLFTFQR